MPKKIQKKNFDIKTGAEKSKCPVSGYLLSIPFAVSNVVVLSKIAYAFIGCDSIFL
jgi:hypothetical protein